MAIQSALHREEIVTK